MLWWMDPLSFFCDAASTTPLLRSTAGSKAAWPPRSVQGQSDSLRPVRWYLSWTGWLLEILSDLYQFSLSHFTHITLKSTLFCYCSNIYYTPYSSLCSDNYIWLNPDIAKHPTLKAKSLNFFLSHLTPHTATLPTTKCLALMLLSLQMTPEVRISEMPVIPQSAKASSSGPGRCRGAGDFAMRLGCLAHVAPMLLPMAFCAIGRFGNDMLHTERFAPRNMVC